MTNAAAKMTPRRERLTLSRAEMADALDLSVSALDRLTRDNPPGCVRGGKGNETRFTAHEFLAWYMDREAGRGEGFEAARTRKMNADAARSELQLAKERGDVAPVAHMTAAWLRAAKMIQVNVMGVAQRAAVRIVGETNESRIKSVLREEIHAALESGANSIEAWAGDGAAEDPLDLTNIAQEGEDE
jgi:phage terminase Nu1 subunit (DNA packaging protein)